MAYAKKWGMNTEIQDLRRVVKQAQRKGRRVVVGGHSLGGSITTAYATWDFKGRAGADGLSGLVFIDGGSGPTPVSVADANTSLSDLAAGSPWLTFGGIPAPFTGLFNTSGALGRHQVAERAVTGSGLRAASREPEAAGAGHEPGPVRIRPRRARPRPPAWSPRRRTSGTWPRAGTRGAGTRRARSPRSGATPAPSPAGA